uniref:Uncharacterized protein n=1 Tax=Aegilops tauschii subsp. strangulata TaxID=200361 RepID=A0A453QDY4_AEGTS
STHYVPICISLARRSTGRKKRHVLSDRAAAMASHFPSLAGLLAHPPLLLYAITWSAVAAMSVAVAALAPELAYVWGIAPGAPLTKACPDGNFAGGSIGLPWDAVCVPAGLFGRTVP